MRKNKLEFSKIIFIITSILVFSFIIFLCYMMYITQDLEPTAYIGASIIALYATSIAFYYNKAKKENELKLEIEKIKQVEKLKKKYNNDNIDIDIDINNNYKGDEEDGMG